MPTRSYLSQVELPVTFRLKDAERIDELTILWPRGKKQIVRNLKAGQTHIIRQPQ